MKLLKFLILLIILTTISVVNGYVIVIHPNTMNITNSSGAYNINPNIIAYKVNDTITFEALAPNSVAQDILENGSVKWDFGDLIETDYGNYRTTTHKYSFPFPYPVAWCGYLNNTGYSKALTYNWLVVGDVANTTYIFNGSPSNSKTKWDVHYNKTNNTVIIKYYSENTVNTYFNRLNVSTTPITVNVGRDEIVKGDTVKFNFSVSRNIILCVWSFGDGTFSFEKSPEHTYNNVGIYYPRVLVIDDSGNVMVGYLDEGIKVNKPRGGYFEPIRDKNKVKNESGAVNVEDEYAMAYRVGEPIYFYPKDANYYTKWFFGDGNETDYDSDYSYSWTSYTYSYPFIYPICWMDVDNWGNYDYASSATLDYLVVDDVGNTIYSFIPTGTDKNNPKITYDSKNHVVNITYYSENINSPTTLKLKQKTHYDVQVTAEEYNRGIKYRFNYPYGKPIFVYWSFGDGTHSLKNSPVHFYPNNGVDYQAHVMIVDENGIVSVGFGPVVENNKIVSPTFNVEPIIVQPNQPFYILYSNYGGREYLDLYFYDYTKYNYITQKIYNYLNPKPDYLIYETTGVSYDISNIKFLNISCKIPWEGIYYVEGYDFDDYEDWLDDNYHTYFIPRQVKVIDNKNPIAKLYIYPNPASYKDAVVFNPLSSYDPDAGRKLSDGSGYIISPDEPSARIYGFNLTVYDSNGNVVWNYSSNELKIVSHRFSPGNYTAILTVWDGMGGVNSTTVKFSVMNRPPVAQFTYSPDKPEPNEDVEFISQSYDPEGEIAYYIWDFGDGTTVNITDAVVHHNYTKPGYYTVTLTVFDRYNASSSISKQVLVAGILADFTYEIINGTTVKFNDTSKVTPGKIIEWHWNFGDGSISQEPNPIHHYSEEGVYPVTLTVKSDTNLTDSVTKIVIVPPIPKYHPVADFTYKIINGTTVEFNSNLSYDKDGTIVKY